jgi:hypothetical protein
MIGGTTPVRVELQFTYKIDDVRDAVAATTQQARRSNLRPSPRWQRWAGLVLSLCVMTGAIIIGWSDLGPVRSADRRPPVQDLVFLLAASVAPALVLILILLQMLVKVLRGSIPTTETTITKPRKLGPTRPARIVSAIMGLLMAGMLLPVVMPTWSVPWQPSRGVAMLIGLGPWIVAWALLVMVNPLSRRRAIDVQWNAAPRWRRPKTMVIDDRIGITVADDLHTNIYRWPYYTRARETERALLLDDEESRIHILPKRALADEMELACVRAIIQNHVADATFLPQLTAFPVIAEPAPPPLEPVPPEPAPPEPSMPYNAPPPLPQQR